MRPTPTTSRYCCQLACCLFIFYSYSQEQETKFRLWPSLYSGANVSLMSDKQFHAGMIIGSNLIINQKHIVNLECSLNFLDGVFIFTPRREYTVQTAINYEISYGRVFNGKERKMKFLWLAGASLQHIYYNGKFLYVEPCPGWFCLDQNVYEEKEYWLPAVVLKARALVNSRILGLSFDLYGVIGKFPEIGIRSNFYIGKLDK